MCVHTSAEQYIEILSYCDIIALELCSIIIIANYYMDVILD